MNNELFNNEILEKIIESDLYRIFYSYPSENIFVSNACCQITQVITLSQNELALVTSGEVTSATCSATLISLKLKQQLQNLIAPLFLRVKPSITVAAKWKITSNPPCALAEIELCLKYQHTA